MPPRSSGCATCRKRKIRCDESRPGCKRCETHNVSCPGYRTDTPGLIQFKDQTTITVKRAKDQYRARQALGRGGSSPALVASNGWTITDSSSPEWLEAESFPTSAGWTDTTTTNSPGWSVLETWPTPESMSGLSPASSFTDYTGSPGFVIEESLTPNGSLILTKSAFRTKQNVQFPISISLLPSPALERRALYASFIDTYLPRIAGTAQNGHFDFYHTIALETSHQPALQASMDALSLVQMGSLHHDKAILKQAVRQYSVALGALGRSIRKNDFLYDDDVLAAVVVLAACELYEEIASMGEGWGQHIQGSNQLVALRGPQSLRSELALLFYSSMRHGSLIHALIARKEPFMATKEWRDVAFRVPNASKDASTKFYDLAIQIPGLLQQHDELDLDSPTALQSIEAILAHSATLESELHDWYTSWQDRAFAGYSILPINSFPTFCALCSDRTFTYAFTFPDFLHAYLHSLHWMVMHYLRTNTQSLHKHRHHLDRDWFPSAEEDVSEEELLGYVLNLCQCIPFFVEPISSSTGSIAVFLPMRCAALYFMAHGHWAWLRWVGNVKNSVFVKGLVPPAVRPDMRKVLPGP
ncbi:hypothetical protein LTR37_010389 [Vermiconidia calcicola]|uniref:Uncharacterized protein n=1 Tax=Vermiconidia calcicola TaxID=1690605 RepID=A0ACC3N558_9PEZI|nr:hypothetical protein LTR37_010389 [Vermiconidia calcicola]